jgi:hypothetical protein
MSTKTSHFANYTENKCGVVRTSHAGQSIETLKSFVSDDPSDVAPDRYMPLVLKIVTHSTEVGLFCTWRRKSL